MTVINLPRLDSAELPDVGCVGVYFRYTENNYFVEGKLVFQKQLSLLKKKSCAGCETCGWILDDAQNGITESGNEFFEFPANLKHGDVVELRFIVDSTDWETGYVEDYHLKIVLSSTHCPPQTPGRR